MGYGLNRPDEPVFIAVSKPLLTEFGIHHRLESMAHDLFSCPFVHLKIRALGNSMPLLFIPMTPPIPSRNSPTLLASLPYITCMTLNSMP